MSYNLEQFKDGLKELQIELNEKQISQFLKYYELLVETNKVMNLTAITEFDEVVEKHFLDSLSLCRVYDLKIDAKILDLGTGAGFPGIPLKIAFPNLELVLADSLNKRIKFLNQVIDELELKDITAVHARAEELGRNKDYREQFDVCVSRAVANLSSLSEYCIPFVKVGGKFISYKSGSIEEEVAEAKKAVFVLGGKVTDVYKFDLYEQKRSFVVIDKEKHNFIKEVILPGQPHVGGLAYDPKHKLLWYSSNINGIAQAVSIKMDTIEAYDYDDSHLPVETFQIVSLYGIVRDSFMTFYEGCLYVGCFEKYNESVIARYGVDEEGKLINTMDEKLGMDFEMAVPLDYSTISEQVQGIAFYNDKLLISHSFGILPSRLVFYEQSDKRLYVNENSARTYRFPERLEQIVVEGDSLYVMFESCAYAYRASSVNIVDRVLKLNLSKMETYDEEESLFFLSE